MDYYIMSGDIETALVSGGSVTILNEELCPIYIKRTRNFERWLEIRAIDTHRANSRLLKKAIRLKEKDDINTVMSVNAVTITDNYWIRPIDSTLKYDKVKFSDDYFAELALRGNYDSFNKAANSGITRTPELTNTGSFEKCWRLVNHEWWMYKTADKNQQFSEVFIYQLAKLLGFAAAEYAAEGDCVKTKDFTGNAAANFESAYSFMEDNEDYIDVVNELERFASECIPDYIRIIFMDTITANPDRHTFNFGVLRDIKSGKIISMAPNFDNNMALISRGYPKSTERKNDIMVRLFNELMDYKPELRQYIPELAPEHIIKAAAMTGIEIEQGIITEFIMNAYKQLV